MPASGTRISTAERTSPTESGQITLLLVGIVLCALLLVVGFAYYGQALVHRARASTAADAVALATAADPTAGRELAHWYRDRGAASSISVEGEQVYTHVRSGPSQATSWAVRGASTTTIAPAVRAVIARASQLLERELAPLRGQGIWVEFSPEHAAAFAVVSIDLGMCAAHPAVDSPDRIRFELC